MFISVFHSFEVKVPMLRHVADPGKFKYLYLKAETIRMSRIKY